MLMPVFTAKNTKALNPIFWDKAKAMANKITVSAQQQSKGNAVKTESIESGTTALTLDLAEWTSRTALDVITLAALGHDFNSLDNPNTPLAQAYHGVFELDRFH